MNVDFRLAGALGDVINDWGHHALLIAVREALLTKRREESDPNVMNALDRASALVTEAADLLTEVGI